MMDDAASDVADFVADVVAASLCRCVGLRSQERWGAKAGRSCAVRRRFVTPPQALGLLLDMDGTFLRCFNV